MHVHVWVLYIKAYKYQHTSSCNHIQLDYKVFNIDICHWCGIQKENKLKRELYLTNYHIKYLYMYKPTWHMLSRISTLYCKLFPLCITWPSVGFGESSLAISDNKIRGFFICRRPKSQDKHNSAFSKQRRSPSIIG